MLGFDMDHTLVRYNSEAFEGLTHRTVLEKLVQKGYSDKILALNFDFSLAIRGLIIDKRKGNLLKVGRHGAIRASYHGITPLDFSEQKKIYGGKYIDLRDGSYSSVDTTFSISTAVLIMQLVDLRDKQAKLGLPDYDTITADVMRAVDQAHADGSLKAAVAKDLGKYIVKDKELVSGLERFRAHDKRLFLLTNSDFHYTKLLLDYAINPFLQKAKDWSEIFEFVIVAAQKPRFFFDNLKFLRVNPKDGTLSNYHEALVPGIYQGGSAHTFTRDLKLEGDDILYVGDHIYGDILRLKKDCNWRTALVIDDLADEISAYEKAQPVQNTIDELMRQKEPLENELVEIVSEQIENGKAKSQAKVDELQKKIGELDNKIAAAIKQQQKYFNPHWGEIMRAGNEESYFASQVDRYACIYMAHLRDMLAISPRTYIRASRRPQAHELAVLSDLELEGHVPG